ncbi:MAG: HAMP domain-containing histidine kinase [Lachnospiraceae bacterium]|nr:HAMP domain-containing histidine kinase [Lachnospiraceae bacterium]
MRFSWAQKYMLSFAMLVVGAFLLISTATSGLLLQRLVKEKAYAFYQEGLYMSSRYVGSYFNEDDNSQTLSSVRTQIEGLSVYLGAQIWLINTDGEIILDSSGTYTTDMRQVISEFSSVLPSGTYYMTGDFFDMFTEETLSVLIPVSHNYHVRGYIAIHLPMSELVSEKESYLQAYYITLILLMALISLFVAVLWFTALRPLRKLQKASAEYASGNFETPVAMDRGDEIGYISCVMDFMAQALRDMDEDQRKMISNVSHDFRSPLTSIKGYIEAMLDGTIPPELQEKYLNIVLRETDRLTNLTSSLLTLNSMDSSLGRLEKTDFDINTLIRDTAATFEGTCTAKRISIDLLFSDWHTSVYADMGKIQQAMYNLIDNAIKFSNPDSTITIETTTRYEKAFVSVRDTGIGIPRDSLKKIWERFYKTDLSRGKDKKGTGLGLSIVREIIQMHEENINVVSTEGVGTEFIFSLSKSAEKGGD